jgi:tripartite-type tricarboxylate transporter receptor subunit TctC
MSDAARTFDEAPKELTPEQRDRLERRASQLAQDPDHQKRVARIEEAVRAGWFDVHAST